MKDRRKSVPAGPYGTLLHAPCLALRTLFPSPHHPQQHPHDSPNAGRCTTFFLLHAEAIFPAFRITPPAGGAPKSGRMLQKKYSNPGENSAQAEVRQAVSSGRKFPPAGMPPGQDRRKSPLKKYGRRKESSHEWPVHSPFPFAAGTFQAERNVRNRCLPEKGSPRKKACCGACHAAAQEAPEKKISTGPTPSAGSARNARERRQKQQNSGGGNLSLTGEQKNFQRLAHGTGKKLAMEKEADQMRRIAHGTGKKKRPARAAWPE